MRAAAPTIILLRLTHRSRSQNSKLVKALQESGLAQETGSKRVGVFGFENVRPPRPSRSGSGSALRLRSGR